MLMVITKINYIAGLGLDFEWTMLGVADGPIRNLVFSALFWILVQLGSTQVPVNVGVLNIVWIYNNTYYT